MDDANDQQAADTNAKNACECGFVFERFPNALEPNAVP